MKQLYHVVITGGNFLKLCYMEATTYKSSTNHLPNRHLVNSCFCFPSASFSGPRFVHIITNLSY